jgi:small redox-active disulfide protein 2
MSVNCKIIKISKIMEIKILGTGCPNCITLERRVRKVVEDNNIDAKIILVKDIMSIMSYNVMSTPALVVNEEVKIKGRVAKPEEILDLLKNV